MNSNKVICFLFRVRRWFAFLICPELRDKHTRSLYQKDYVSYLVKERMKESRGHNKAIARLQKERRDMRYQISILTQNKEEGSEHIRKLQHSIQELLAENNQLKEKVKAF